MGCVRTSDQIYLKDTYSYKLQQHLPFGNYVINWSAGSNSSRSIRSKSVLTNLLTSEPAFVIIQVGIVDCAPRLLSTVERFVVGLMIRIPILGVFARMYISFKSHYRIHLTKIFKRTCVPLVEYRDNMRFVIESILQTKRIEKVAIINIASPGDYLISRSYGICNNIKLYNSIIDEIANAQKENILVVNLHEITERNPSWINQSDGHHITAEAHDWIAKQLLRLFGSTQVEQT